MNALLFRTGTARRLVLTQTALAAIIGLRIALGPYPDLAGQPPALFRPVSFLHALDGMPGPLAILVLQIVGTIAAALAAAGWRRRATLPVAWVCLLVLAGLRSSRGKVLHNDSLLLLAAVPFLLASAATWRGRPATSPRYGWPVQTALAVVAGAYFFSGLSKLVYSGAAWVASDNMRHVLYGAAGSGKVRWPDVPLWLADQAWLTHGLAAAILLLELTFPIVLVAGPRIRASYAAGAVAFHAGTWLVLGLDYWAWAAVATLVLVDGCRFFERSHRYPRSRQPAAGNHRPTADVVAAEWHEKAEVPTCEKVAVGADASARSSPSSPSSPPSSSS